MRKRKMTFEDPQYNHGYFSPYWLFRQCKLTVAIIFSTILLTIVGICAGLFSDYKLQFSLQHPVFACLFLQEKEEVPKEADKKTMVAMKQQKKEKPKKQKEAEEEKPIFVKYQKVKKIHETSPYYDDPGKIALTTEYAYCQVNQSYYNDALFIGDSRVEGLHDYSGLNNATFYYQQGLTVYDMMKKKIAKVGDGKKVTIPEALSQIQFGKIYIMVGINELGYRTTAEYAAQYQKNIEMIRRLQPHAAIYIMAIMHETTEKSAQSDVFNNVNINDKNVSVAGFANGIDTFYIDVNPVLTDPQGGIKKDYTWDGVHLKAEYYKYWVEFLNAHGLQNQTLQKLAGVNTENTSEQNVKEETDKTFSQEKNKNEQDKK